MLLVHKKHLVVLSSPQRDNYADLWKKNSTKMLYMPVWSKDKIDAIRELFQTPAEQVEKRYATFGGIPRYVFADKDNVIVRPSLYSNFPAHHCSDELLCFHLSEPACAVAAYANGKHKDGVSHGERKL